jgi:hypothetical protein
MNTKVADYVVVGVAGVGITAVVGACLYGTLSNRQATGEQKLQNDIRNSIRLQQQHVSSPERKWHECLDIPNLSGDQTLFNAVDSLSVFWYSDRNAFLRIVQAIEDFYAMYNSVGQDNNDGSPGGVHASLGTRDSVHDPSGTPTGGVLASLGTIGLGSQYQLIILNLVGRFEESVRRHYREDERIMYEFKVRSQTVLQICDSYNVNIIRETKK